MDKRLLEIIVCPMCNGKLNYFPEKQALVCRFDRLAFPIDEGIPVLIPEEAKALTEAELSSFSEE